LNIGRKRLSQIAIGRGDRADAGPPQLVDEPILKRAIDALAAPAGLRRETDDMCDPELPQGAPQRRELAPIGRRAGGRRVHGPVRAIGVQGAGDPVGLEDVPQHRPDRDRTLTALDQAGVQPLRGRIVDDGQPRLPGVRHQR